MKIHEGKDKGKKTYTSAYGPSSQRNRGKLSKVDKRQTSVNGNVSSSSTCDQLTKMHLNIRCIQSHKKKHSV